MRRLLLLLAVFAGIAAAQVTFANPVNSGASLPATCSPGGLVPAWFLLTAGGPVATPYYCSAPNTWTAASGGASGITIGTTSVSGGANTQVLFDNAGVVGEYSVTGTPGVLGVVLGTGPTITQPHIQQILGVSGGPVSVGPTAYAAFGGTTFDVFDATASTGVTKVTVKEGANQIGGGFLPSMVWLNNAGTTFAQVKSSGNNVTFQGQGFSDDEVGSFSFELRSALLLTSSTFNQQWTSGNTTAGADTNISRISAGLIGIGKGTQGTTTGTLQVSALQSVGTKFTATGCSVGTLVGGATAGTFTLGANGPCTVVITMGDTDTSPTGWSCFASDQSVLTALVDQSASNATTASLNMPAAALSGNVISFGCIGR